MVGSKKAQLGAFLMARWVLLMLILVTMLVVPIWLKKNNDGKEKERAAKEEAINNPAPVAVEKAQRGIGYGLTFALNPNGDTAPPGVAHFSCNGEPKPTDRPQDNACNPYRGDTSCSVVLPVLCFKPEGLANPAGANSTPVAAWTGGIFAATAPVMGAILESQDIANARCEKQLGSGFRMSDWHAAGGYAMRGQSGQGVSTETGTTRFWVAIKDQAANCWNSPP